MASKIKVTRQKLEMPEKEGHETPLFDLSDAAVKALIRSAKKRGYVTHVQGGGPRDQALSDDPPMPC